MNKPTLVDDILSITMGTTGILISLEEKINLDYIVDNLDDSRREIYIQKIEKNILKLEKFSSEFNNDKFSKWVKNFINFLREDLEKQLYYENLSDDLRDKLFLEISSNKKRLRNENNELDKKFFLKKYVK